jgi:hypothetical protein
MQTMQAPVDRVKRVATTVAKQAVDGIEHLATEIRDRVTS